MGEEAGAPVSGWLRVTGVCVQSVCVCVRGGVSGVAWAPGRGCQGQRLMYWSVKGWVARSWLCDGGGTGGSGGRGRCFPPSPVPWPHRCRDLLIFGISKKRFPPSAKFK